MNTDLLKILNEIVEKYGEPILSEPRRVSALFADLAREVPKPQKSAFIKSLEQGSAQVLKNAEESERENCKQRLAQKLNSEEGLELDLCRDTLDLLEKVLFSGPKSAKQKKIICQNCSKELQEDWKVCPYCSTSAEEPVVLPVGKNAAEQKANSAFSSGSGGSGYGIWLIEPDENDKNGNGPLEQLRKKAKNTKIGLIVTIIISTIAIIIMGIFIFSLDEEADYYYMQNNTLQNDYETLQRNYRGLNNDYQNLQQNYRALQNDYNSAKSIYRIRITSLRVGNVNNGTWLTDAGSPLYSSAIRYLTPLITYNSDINEDVVFYIKIINPNGTVKTGSYSPSGYSYSSTVHVYRGNNQSLSLSGFGNSDSSSYYAGQYTIEVWYNFICLASEKVSIR